VLPPSPLNQPACKPGSVRRRANPPRDGHSSGTPVTRRLEQPTRTTGPGHRSRAPALARECSRRPYSVLLPVGFAVPLPLPEARCALTAPFHPYPPSPLRASAGGLFSVALSLKSTRREPSRPRRTLSGTACPWSPDFPPGAAFRRCPKRPSGRLTGKVWGHGASTSRVVPPRLLTQSARRPAPTSRCGPGRSSCARCACRACRVRPDTSPACRTDCRRRADALR
jgi:hypothetical protein